MTAIPDRGMAPQIVVVGAATRDVGPSVSGRWRLGGGAAYGALVLARLGLRVGLVLGVDADAAGAPEIDLHLGAAGIEVVPVPLDRGPIFQLDQDRTGRSLRSPGPSDPIPPGGLPGAWSGCLGWLFAPVDDELGDGWADHPPAMAIVALGWQGLLRMHGPDGRIRPRTPVEHPLVRRAEIVGLSREDLDPATELADLARLLRPGATLALTDGERGGVLATIGPSGSIGARRRFPAIPARPLDPTGAGDAFLAGFLAARVEPRLVGGRTTTDWAARLAATVASLVVEGSGLAGVPDRAAIRRRLRDPGEAVGRP